MSNNNIVPGFNDEKDDSLRINLEKVPEVENCLTIYLIGYIDTYNSSFFQKRIARVVEAGYVSELCFFDWNWLFYCVFKNGKTEGRRCCSSRNSAESLRSFPAFGL